ncbi:MAG: hypothetical protein FWG66_02700 [Spirochaetes bacterium]|nr:hypothetical protein [Spirochaetota bacterium]
MKKLLVLFMAFTVTAAADAQLHIWGQFHHQFQVRFWNADSAGITGWDGDENPRLGFNFFNSATHLNASFLGQNVSGFVRFRGDNQWRGFVWGNVGQGFQWGLGVLELPFIQPSGITFMNQNNWGIGNLASTPNAYFAGRFTVAPGMSFYAGFSEAGILLTDGGPAQGNRSGAADWGRLRGRRGDLTNDDGWATPIFGFFTGFDFSEPGVFSGGVAFATLPWFYNSPDGRDNIFSYKVSLRGQFFNVGPASAIGFTVAFYQDPEFGFFAVGSLPGGTAPFSHIARRAVPALTALPDFGFMVIESGFHAHFPTPLGLAVLSYGFLTNLDSSSDAMGHQAAAQITLSFGNGFRLIPGTIVRLETNHAGNFRMVTDVGVNMQFSF